MEVPDWIIRAFSLVLIVGSLYFSKRVSGPSVFNIPLWNGLGVLVLYILYCISGIQFENGISTDAEILLSLYIVVAIISFAIGERIARRWRGRSLVSLNTFLGKQDSVPSLPWHFLLLYLMLFLAFILILTKGNLLLIITGAPELKFERLKAIAEKNPLLLNLDQFVLASTILISTWLTLEIRPGFIPKLKGSLSLACLIIYVLSTGSRSPLMSLLLQAIVSLRLVRLRFGRSPMFLRSKFARFLAISLCAAFLIYTTNQRMVFEGLDLGVFSAYFHATSLGHAGDLLDQKGPVEFLLGTIIVYLAATFNNFIIRFQELANIDPSMGYRFCFFYLSAAKILLPAFDFTWLNEWQDIAKSNWTHLESISMSAGQWSMSYGDLIWDYGAIATFFLVIAWGVLAGFILGRAKARPSFKAVLWLAVFAGFSLSPLVNPFLSLYVQYLLAMLVLLKFVPERMLGIARSTPVLNFQPHLGGTS
jgi:hypothetical protein